ncbi:response regulator [Marivita geojedonensis]|uniref:response regulator n=1 Tax=Marivita geojedonensis TaxID=1123756 RepID=UPI000D4D4129|nr:response regulator [Marivita geojedonensis]PRY74206.1 response regulator receiver domain-containing protein [Marivita geojedonensis]
MRILAVDDDPIVIDLLEAMLSDLGHTDVQSVQDGKLAIKALTESRREFDCILLDISMPNITGIEVCRLIRSEPEFATIPIVMMTALRDKESVDSAFRAGATDYVNKPLDVVELEMRLRAVQNINDKRRHALENAVEYPPLNLRTVNRYDVIKVDGVDDLIDYTALCNYLAHLSLAGLETRQVLGVKLHDFEQIAMRASAQELSFFLSEIADVIADQFRRYDCMMSYCGDGSFIVVTDKSKLESSVYLEERVAAALTDRNLEYDDGRVVYLDVSISNPIRPNTSKKQRVRKTFDRAIGRAEARMARKTRMRSRHNQYGGTDLRVVRSGQG